MAGLDPAIHVLFEATAKDVDARDKPGHDEREKSGNSNHDNQV
jgi:hypothetical protein